MLKLSIQLWWKNSNTILFPFTSRLVPQVLIIASFELLMGREKIRVLRYLTTSILLGILFVLSTLPAKASPDADILSHSGYLDSAGYYHVVGEVQNVGEQEVNHLCIAATFYDSGDDVVATANAYTEIGVLLVERKSPFDLHLDNTTQSAKVDHYSLNLTFSPTGPIPMGLEILSNSSYISGDVMHIIGEIKNVGSGIATSIKVVATCYDAAEKVVAVGHQWGAVDCPYPGSMDTFECWVSDGRVPYVDRYELTAESAQFALISEFPSLVTLSLFMSVISLATIAYRRKSRL